MSRLSHTYRSTHNLADLSHMGHAGRPHEQFTTNGRLSHIASVRLSLFHRSVTDLRPRKLDVEQCTLLCNLAELVARGLEMASAYITDSLANPQHSAEPSTPSGTAAAAAV